MGLTVTEDTPADMLAGNMELLVQLPPRIDEDYDNDEINEGDEDDRVHQHHRNHHRHHNHHHSNGHHPRRTVNGNARRVTVARSTPMMDLLVQVATSQKLSASSYTLEAIGEHGLVLTHHPNTPIGALDALQVKLLPKQGTFVPMKTRHVNQPFEQTFRLQVHLPRNQLYVSRVSSRMNLGKILDEVCREKNLDRNNYELCHPANIEETLDLSLSLQDYHLQEVTLCPKRRSMGSSLSSQDIMALQRQEERRRQEAKQSVFGFAFKKSKESSLSTDSLGERSVSPARSDGTGRSASPQAPAAPTRPQRKRRPAPKPPMPRVEQSEEKSESNAAKDIEKNTEKESENPERIIVISHSRNSSDSSGYHEASVLSDNLDSNIRVPETLPRRSRLQPPNQEPSIRTLAESSQASKSLGNLAAVPRQRATIARGASNSSLSSAGLRKKKAAPAPPQPRPLSSAISTQALERIVDSEESLTSVSESFTEKASSDLAVATKRNLNISRTSLENGGQGPSGKPKNEIEEIVKIEKKIERRDSGRNYCGIETSELDPSATDPSISRSEIAENPVIPNVETARERKRAVGVDPPVPKPRGAFGRLENIASYSPPETEMKKPLVQQSMSNLDRLENIPKLIESGDNVDDNFGQHAEDDHQDNLKLNNSVDESPRPMPRSKANHENDLSPHPDDIKTRNGNGVASNFVVAEAAEAAPRLPMPVKNLRGISAGDDSDIDLIYRNVINIPKKPIRKTLEKSEMVTGGEEELEEPRTGSNITEEERRNVGEKREKIRLEEIHSAKTIEMKKTVEAEGKIIRKKRRFAPKVNTETRRTAPVPPAATIKPENEIQKASKIAQSAISINDGKRSCAVISTIPKCDNFGENDRKRLGDEVPEYNLMTRIDSSLGSSFGAGKSILDGNYQQDIESIGTSSMTTDVTNSGSDDELEFESFEMFEQSKKVPKLSKLLRSHSELNNFEINTFEGNGRHLTSRSVDFTFALNPHLSRNISDLSTDAYPEKHFKRHLSLNDSTPSETNSKILIPANTKLPAFLATSITWEKQELLLNDEDLAAHQNASTLRESGSGNDDATLSTKPLTKDEETTSDLLKKVSDTLSESLRSPVVVGATSSLANEQDSNAHSVDKLQRTEDGGLRVIEAKQLPEVDENRENGKEVVNNGRSSINSNFHDNREDTEIKETEYSTTSDFMQNSNSEDINPSSTANDWEYILPEPPTAFRDTNVVEDRQVFTPIPSSKNLTNAENVGKSNSEVTSKEKPASRTPEKSKSKVVETVVTNGSSLDRRPSNAVRSDNGGLRSRTTSGSSEIGSEQLAIEKGRSSRTGIIKSSNDSESRRGSQASSTPSIAPVDNTLSNFVITTYSRPKNVDIFNEIEQKVREPEVIISRKNSTANSGHNNGSFFESRKSSTASEIMQPRNYGMEEKMNAVIVAPKKPSQTELTAKINNDVHESENKNDKSQSDGNLVDNLNRSNIKISIATKPRQRGDSINESQRPKSLFVNIEEEHRSSNSREEVKSDEETSRESVTGNNKKFSQWRENILNKQEIPTTEKQFQSLQVLRSILPHLDDPQPNSDDSNVTEKADLNPSEETRMVAPLPNNNADIQTESSTISSSSNEPRQKRYTYAGPPAINLGSWSDRSRTTKVQIKPDNDYKFEKSRTPEAGIREISYSKTENHSNKIVNKSTVTINSTNTVKNFHTISTTYENDVRIDKKEPNELAKTLIARTTASGFKRPVSMSVESSGTIIRSKNDEGIRNDEISKKAEEEIDTRPINFKELKEAFAKDQNTNSTSIPKYGTFRKSDNSVTKITVRRDSNHSLNSDNENTSRKEPQGVENSRSNNKPAVYVQEKRNSVVLPQTNNRNGVQEAMRKNSRATLMPVVKGFKIPISNEDEAINLSHEKRPAGYRIAIGDISNGNHPTMQNGIRKNLTIKVDEVNSNVPKPPPTMPVITGVTLKSNNHISPRQKSMPVAEPDTRNQLLESIRNFGGQNQLRRAPRRNTNIGGTSGSRSVRS